MKHITAALTAALMMIGLQMAIMTAKISLNAKTVNEVDERTKFLCREYASRDHRGEIAPERYEKMKDMIVNYDWYQSCIDHVRYPVAGGDK